MGNAGLISSTVGTWRMHERRHAQAGAVSEMSCRALRCRHPLFPAGPQEAAGKLPENELSPTAKSPLPQTEIPKSLKALYNSYGQGVAGLVQALGRLCRQLTADSIRNRGSRKCQAFGVEDFETFEIGMFSAVILRPLHNPKL